MGVVTEHLNSQERSTSLVPLAMHGLYLPLASLRPDERFGPVSTQHTGPASSLENRECASI